MQHVLGNSIQCDSGSLFELVYICRKRGGGINQALHISPEEKIAGGQVNAEAISTSHCLRQQHARSIYLADCHWDKPAQWASSEVEHRPVAQILACLYTCCVNLKLFKQELPKLLDCKMMSHFLKHPVFLVDSFSTRSPNMLHANMKLLIRRLVGK